MGIMTSHLTNNFGRQISTLANAKVQQELNRRRECRKAIIDHALNVMNKVDRPEEVSTTALIAKMAIPRDVFKRLFDGIDDFQDALIEEGWKELMRQLRIMATQAGGRKGLDGITRAYRNYVKENSGAYYVAMCQGRDTPVGRKYVSRLGRLLYIVLASCDLGQIDLSRAAQNLADVLHGLAVMEITGETFGEVDDTVTHILKVYLNDLFNGAKA